MDLPTQSSLGFGRRGLALPAAMFALVAVSALMGGLFTLADLSARAVRNREGAARATHVAEAGLAHTLGTLRGDLRRHKFTRLLRGSDDLVPTADDSLIVGYGLAAGQDIPAGGKTLPQGGTYYVTVRDDPADPDANPFIDLNGRVLVRCRGVTPDGSVADVETIIGATPFPGIAANGNVSMNGTPTISGACGGVHANGDLSGAGTVVVDGAATATGTVDGTFYLPDGSPAPELSSQPPVPIPSLNPLDYCPGADYRLRSDGFMVVAATGQVLDARSSEVFGWKHKANPPTVVKWTLDGGAAAVGTFCVEGNAYVTGNPGSPATPLKMSIIATGSIEVSGNPYMTAEHDDGIMLLAGGDVSVSGNPEASSDNYSGLIYAGAQCNGAGNASIAGQMLCADGAQPAGSVNLASSHSFVGNFKLKFDCSANLWNKRRVLFWYPQLGA